MNFLLSHIYTGVVEGSVCEERAEEMLRLAHAYARPDLKQHLEGCLARRLSLENFTVMAELAHSHDPCPVLMKVGALAPPTPFTH